MAARSREVTALRAACDGCDPGRPHDEHVCEPALWLVTAGAFVMRDRRGAHVLDPTRAIALAAGEPFTIRHPNGPDTCIALRGTLVDELLADGPRVIDLDAPTHARIVAAVAACRRGDADALLIAESLAVLDRSRPRAHDNELARALAYQLQLSFAAPTSLAELAAAVGTSIFHACRVFRRATGTTLHGYRRRLRVRHALALLVDSDASIAEIAAQTGFASQSHLTNVFRGEFGTTPGRARRSR
ncbi:MAG TPA: helix-turn-helix transcriptional regulator [Kofleriaceae bacterium]|nr:helix-turn-helix transcriptional regulator [Kofleriaceae bacterium]